MQIWYSNKVTPSLTFTASSESANFPAENVGNDLLAKTWRTGTSTADETLVIDLGSAQAIQGFVCYAHDLTASDSAIKIQGNASDSWGSPSVDETLTHSTGAISHEWSSDQTYRYWRFIFTKSSSGEERNIGRLFLGSRKSDFDKPDWNGVGDELASLSDTTKARGGQIYGEPKPRYREWDCNFRQMHNGNKRWFQETFFPLVDIHTPFFLEVDEDTYGLDNVVMTRFADTPDFQAYGTRRYLFATLPGPSPVYRTEVGWRTRMRLEEWI